MGKCTGALCPMQYDKIDVDHCEAKSCPCRTEGLSQGQINNLIAASFLSMVQQIKRLEKENKELKEELIKWKKIARASMR